MCPAKILSCYFGIVCMGQLPNKSLIRKKYYAPVAQLDRVPGYEPGGRRFESFRARHFHKNLQIFRNVKISIEAVWQAPYYTNKEIAKVVSPGLAFLTHARSPRPVPQCGNK